MLASKENKEAFPPRIYDKLLENQAELVNYLRYIRLKQPASKIVFNLDFLKDSSEVIPPSKERRQAGNVRLYIDRYLHILREVMNIENSMGKKIIRKIIQYLEEFPSMGFLVEVQNSFGKEKKRLCFNESVLVQHSYDDMIPLFQKIVDRVEVLKKEAESKKLMEMGHRIKHLQWMVESTKHQAADFDNGQIFKVFEPQRVEKYILMEESINKAQRNYGRFSQTFSKSKEVFSNLNKVYTQISQIKPE